jgi:N-acetylmuramoyl-L-alanine amidase
MAAVLVPGVRAAEPVITSAAVGGSPFSPNGDGIRESTTLYLKLSRPAKITVSVLTFSGSLLNTIVPATDRAAGGYAIPWYGRDSAGRVVQNGPYRFRVDATTAEGTERVERLTTKADLVVYGRARDLITVIVDPGHGGRDPGAQYGGYREKDLNLDVALRLRSMLHAAGIRVVMTRDADIDNNTPRIDRTGDGVIDRRDDLQARLDIGNRQRADVSVAVHLNASGCHCGRGPSTYTGLQRSWAAENRQYATQIQSEFVRILRRLAPAGTEIKDGGVRDGNNHHQMRGYDAATAPRPSLMPLSLGEPLYMDQPAELEMVALGRVRTGIAEAYYNGIARYLNARAFGVRYSPITAPRSATVASSVDYTLEIANRGNRTLSGATLRLGAVPAVAEYDGSGAAGSPIGAAVLPSLAPGARTRVTVTGTAPVTEGEWLVKGDVMLADGRRLSDLGVVAVQLPLTTTVTP